MNLTDLLDSIEEPEPRRSRKTLLLSGDDLLTQAIGLFLEEGGAWDVVKISSDKGVDKLIQEAKRVKPDVVILCRNRSGEDSVLPLQLINEQLCPRVVTLGLESNLLQMYSKHNFIIQEVSDLLSIVESGFFPKCASGKEVG